MCSTELLCHSIERDAKLINLVSGCVLSKLLSVIRHDKNAGLKYFYIKIAIMLQHTDENQHCWCSVLFERLRTTFIGIKDFSFSIFYSLLSFEAVFLQQT
uniref:Uncharacterized protein n=1 Tax=Strigamia maritima TaxID=126957 RepID=T1JK75_STRMM